MSKPKPSDPKAVGAAQTGTSVTTALANAYLNNPNEVGPDGTKTTTNGEMQTFTDPSSGLTYQVPRQTITTTLSDAQQAIKGQQDGASLNLATLGNNLSGKLGNQLTDNFKLGNEATESRLMQLGRSRLDPMLADRQQALETQLSNQGIKRGSTAFDKAMQSNTQGANDAYNQLLLTGRGQASNELLTEDNQRINQISALLNGGQVSQPNFQTGFQASQIPTTDMAGIYANYDRQKAANAGAAGASFGSALGGLGGLFALSDERAKTDIKKVGKIRGQEIHQYRYKSGGPMQLGLIAQKVEKVTPSAVKTGSDGLKRVNYSAAMKMGA
jgi:hypothetical protein